MTPFIAIIDGDYVPRTPRCPDHYWPYDPSCPACRQYMWSEHHRRQDRVETWEEQDDGQA